MQSSSTISEKEKRQLYEREEKYHQVDKLGWYLDEIENSIEVICKNSGKISKDWKDISNSIGDIIKTIHKYASIFTGGAIGGTIYLLYPLADAVLKGNSKVSVDLLPLSIFTILGGTAGYLVYRRHYRTKFNRIRPDL